MKTFDFLNFPGDKKLPTMAQTTVLFLMKMFIFRIFLGIKDKKKITMPL